MQPHIHPPTHTQSTHSAHYTYIHSLSLNLFYSFSFCHTYEHTENISFTISFTHSLSHCSSQHKSHGSIQSFIVLYLVLCICLFWYNGKFLFYVAVRLSAVCTLVFSQFGSFYTIVCIYASILLFLYLTLVHVVFCASLEVLYFS